MHIHFKNLFQSVSDFLTCCGPQGVNYCEKKEVENPLSFSIDFELEEKLETCFKVINAQEWEASCSWICEEFNPAFVAKLFQGNWKKIRQLQIYVKEKSNFIIKSKTTDEKETKKERKL